MFGIQQIKNLINTRFSAFIKKGISTYPHFVPLNLKVLERTLSSIISQQGSTRSTPRKFDLPGFRVKLLGRLRSTYKNSIVLTNGNVVVNGVKNMPIATILSQYTPAIVYIDSVNSANTAGILFNSYQAASAGLLNEILNKEFKEFLKENLLTKGHEFDLGYIFRTQESANEPEGLKLRNLFGILNSTSNNTVNLHNADVSGNKASLAQSTMLVNSLLKDYATYEARKLGTFDLAIEKKVASFVASIKADVLIIHDTSQREEIQQTIKSSKMTQEIAGILPNLRIFAKSLVEDIRSNIRNLFTSDKKKKTKTERAKTSSSIPGKKNTVNVKAVKGLQSEFIIPPPFISITSLQNLLNSKLADYVEREMGTAGDPSKHILTYRTGRLAESYKVTAISQGRDGALTTFFTYMKYPYQTFAPGGKQGSPRSRDPKFLGQRAIRQIAKDNTIERLRATVLV